MFTSLFILCVCVYTYACVEVRGQFTRVRVLSFYRVLTNELILLGLAASTFLPSEPFQPTLLIYLFLFFYIYVCMCVCMFVCMTQLCYGVHAEVRESPGNHFSPFTIWILGTKLMLAGFVTSSKPASTR